MDKSEGEKNEQVNGVSFLSENIAARDGEKQFTNVEGAEERAREAKKKAEAEAKAQQQAQEELIRQTLEQKKQAARDEAEAKKVEKKVERAEKLEDRKKIWKRIVIIAAIALVIVAGVVTFFLLTGDSKKEELDTRYVEALSIAQQTRAAADTIRLAKDTNFQDAIVYFEESITNAKNSAEKVYISCYYAEYVVDIANDMDLAYEILDRAKGFSTNEMEDSIIEESKNKIEAKDE